MVFEFSHVLVEKSVLVYLVGWCFSPTLQVKQQTAIHSDFLEIFRQFGQKGLGKMLGGTIKLLPY